MENNLIRGLVGPSEETIKLYKELGIDLEAELQADAKTEAEAS